jgi:uncharacterized protein YxjI
VNERPYLEHDRFIIRQRIRLVSNRYELYRAGPNGEELELIGFVQQKIAALKEDIRAYTGPDKQSELFRIKARQVFDPRARYKVTDGEGNHIGELGKDFARSLTRSTWRIYSPDGREIAWAKERSLFRALLRRLQGLFGFIPIVGELLELIPIRYHFDFFLTADPELTGPTKPAPIGSLERLFGLRDRYLLDLSGDVERRIDRRVALALAVGMDAMQAR